jgi:23S rRNA (guanosine2251-2'-O)-methyltransferase
MRKLKNEELNRISIEEFKITKKNSFAIVLDNVRSLNNVGSAFRTGDAFLVDKLYLCGFTGTPPNREINKTALGATDSVMWEHYASTMEAVAQLKKESYTIVSIEQAEGSVMLQEFQPAAEKKYAFVFGNEVFGVEEEVVAASDVCLEIPQFGTKHSLNISVTIGIVTWDFLSKMKFLS